MILVFLLFSLIIILLLLTFIFLISSVKIEISKLHISNLSNTLQISFFSKIGIYLFNKIKLIEIKIDDNKIKKLYKSGKISFRDIKNNKQINLENLKLIKINVERLKLIGNIGLENAAYTAYLTTIINSIIPVIMLNNAKNYKEENYIYEVKPLYISQNLVNLELNCIITIKIVNIINTIINILKKGRVSVNERTSNRGSYDYGYE